MARRKRRWILPAVAGVMIAGVGAAMAFGGDEEEDGDGGGGTREPYTDPLPAPPWRLYEVRKYICEAHEEGLVGEEVITKYAVNQIWTDVPWPPIAADDDTINEAWDKTLEQAKGFANALLDGSLEKWCKPVIVGERQDGEPAIATGVVQEGEEPTIGAVEVKPDLTPWETDPGQWPQLGKFWQVKKGEIFLGGPPDSGAGNKIVYRALHTAAFKAAKQYLGYGDEAALDYAESIAGNKSRRIELLNLWLCSPWNDALYSTYGSGEKAWVGPHGRSIRLIGKIHPDNRKRISEGLAPARNIHLGDPSWRAEGREAEGEWSEFQEEREYLWLVPLDLVALSEGRIEVDPTMWPGVADEFLRTKFWPPPAITGLGVANVETGMTWGCATMVEVVL